MLLRQYSSCFAYLRSAEGDWAAFGIEAPFLLYEFTSGRVSGLRDTGHYYSHRIEGLGGRRDLAGFLAFTVEWLTDSSYTLAEASEAMGEKRVNVERLQKLRYWWLSPGVGRFSS